MFCRLKNDTDFGKIHIPAPVTSSNLFISEAIKHSYILYLLLVVASSRHLKTGMIPFTFLYYVRLGDT